MFVLSDHALSRLIGRSRRARLFGDFAQVVVGIGTATYLVYASMFHVALSVYMFEDLHMNDFGKFYYSAKAYLSGDSIYGPTLATTIPLVDDEVKQFWNMNPPHFHLLILPLALLPPGQAITVWALLNLAALVGGAAVLSRELLWQWSPRRIFWTTVILVASGLTGIILVTGQFTFPLMLAVTIAWRTDRRGQSLRAAAWLGAVASVKPFLGLFGVLFLVRRDWRAAGTMAATGAGALLVGLMLFGLEEHERWLFALSAVDWMWAPMNGALGGLLSRALGTPPYFRTFIDAPWLVQPIVLVLAAAVAAVTFSVVARDGSPLRIDRGYLGTLLAAQLMSPLGWVYYLPLATGPALMLFSHRQPCAWRDRLIVAATPIFFLPLSFAFLFRETPWGGITFGSQYTWMTLALWLAWLADARSTARATREPA